MWFLIIDIIEALTQTDRPRKYWSDLKIKLYQDGFEVSEKIGQLKLIAKNKGYKNIYCDVYDVNTNSVKYHKKHKFKPIYMIYERKV